MTTKTTKDAEDWTKKSVVTMDGDKSGDFKISDMIRCGKYVSYLTFVYFVMTLSQVCNLLYMAFADRKPKVEDVCASKYPNYMETKACNKTNCWVTLNGSVNVICSKSTYDFIPIRNDFEVPAEYVKLGTTVQNIGLMIGAIMAGNLADVFGRKKILILFTIGLTIFLAVTPFAPSFIVFTIFRFIDMIFTGGKHCVCIPYFMENLPDKHRMWVATVVTYSPNYITLSGIAYLCKDWKTLSWASAAITATLLIMIPILKDSPRWLIKKGRGQEASKAVLYIYKWDKQTTPEKEEQIINVVQKAANEEAENLKKHKKSYYFYHLFTDWKLGSYAIVFAISLFSTSFISYGIAYNMDALVGTVYINVIILGATRWIINIVAASLEVSFKSIGRRTLHLTSVGLISFIMAILFLIYLFTWPRIETYKAIKKAGGTGEALIHAIIVFTRYACLLAAAVCSELFILDSVQPTELFPTPVRSAGIAFIQTFNRLGTIVSPLVFIPSKHWPPAPFVLMFLTSMADFLLYFFLIPETRGKKLIDRMPGEAPSGAEKISQGISASTGKETASDQHPSALKQNGGSALPPESTNPESGNNKMDQENKRDESRSEDVDKETK